MLKFFTQNFKITNDCIILATPMVLFFIIIQWYTQTFAPIVTSSGNYIVYLLTLWIWISGCFAGWFYMVKKTLQFSKRTYLFDTDRTSALSKLLLCLYKGIGKFFLSFLILIALCFGFKMLKYGLLLTLFKLPYKFDMSQVEIISLILVLLFWYFFIYWIPEIVYTYSNPFKAMIIAVKKSILSFKRTFILYLFIIIAGLILHFSFLKSQELPVVYFLITISAYYFTLYSVILIFRDYERNYVEQN